MMFKILVSFLLLNIQSCTSSTHIMKSEKESMVEIHFQDFFKNDMVSLTLNSCKILENKNLVSDPSLGITDVIVKGYLQDKHTIILLYKEISITCNNTFNQVKLSVLFNNVKEEYLIDLRKGKYLGFSKKSESNLIFRQSLKPFIYD